MSLPMVFVQARMASQRFPGKVLAPLDGKPVIERVIDRVASAVPRNRIVLCTSKNYSDEPLARFVRGWCFVHVYRGPEQNVVKRLQGCLDCHPCERFFRVCGDSPLLDPALFAPFLEVPGEPDLVSNTWPGKTFGKGQSLELIRTETFMALDPEALTADQREHPTKVFYDNLEDYYTVGIRSNSPPGPDVAVDTIEDLCRIEALL